MKKFEEGWMLSVLRMGASNTWFFVSPENAASIDYSKVSPDDISSIKFKEARELLRKAQNAAHSDVLSDNGLPLVSVFVHTSINLHK